jgi:recombination protein RecT
MKTDGSDATTKEVAKKPRTLKDWLNENKGSFVQALPANTINIDRFIAAAAMEIMNNAKLMSCSKPSISASLLMAARYGMEVGPLLGQAWLIPYNESVNRDGKWSKEMTCHFQLGYKGLIVLARRSNTIKTISCEVVYEHDIFEVELGMGRKLTLKINIREERGDPIAFYCLVELDNGGVQFGVMSKKDIEKHRNTFSKGYDASDKDNIWVKNFDAMALKTVAIRTLKLCPISVEALEAVSREERIEAGLINVTPTDDFGVGPADGSPELPEDDAVGSTTAAIEEPSDEGNVNKIAKAAAGKTTEPILVKTAPAQAEKTDAQIQQELMNEAEELGMTGTVPPDFEA